MTREGLNSDLWWLAVVKDSSQRHLWLRFSPPRVHVFTFHRWEISIANDISSTRWQRSCGRCGGLTLEQVKNVQRSIDIIYVSRGKPVSLSPLHTHTHTHTHVSIISMQLEPNKHHQAIKMPKLHQFLCSCRRIHGDTSSFTLCIL